MAGLVEIPVNMLGQALTDITIQAALLRLNPEMNFDWGGRLNLWHPYLGGKQGVYYRSQHICSMDRGTIPQAAIWSTKTESCHLPASDLTWAEINDKFTCQEVKYDLEGNPQPTGWYFVNRRVKDRLLYIGWQASLRKICRAKIPGITPKTLGDELGVTVDLLKQIDDCEVAENRTHLYDHKGTPISLGA